MVVQWDIYKFLGEYFNKIINTNPKTFINVLPEGVGTLFTDDIHLTGISIPRIQICTAKIRQPFFFECNPERPRGNGLSQEILRAVQNLEILVKPSPFLAYKVLAESTIGLLFNFKNCFQIFSISLTFCLGRFGKIAAI